MFVEPWSSCSRTVVIVMFYVLLMNEEKNDADDQS